MEKLELKSVIKVCQTEELSEEEYECCSIDKMDKAVEIILNLIEIDR